jgi:hypothetical protein
MTKKNIQCSLVDLRRTTVLRAQGWHEFDGVMGSRHRELGEDGDAADSGTAWVIGVVGLGMAWGAQCHMLREDDVVAGSEWHRGLGDEACVVDSGTSSGQGRWRCVRASIVVRNDGVDALGRTQ